MDLAEYQLLAQKTALPTSLSEEYLVPMIIGEIGELFGQKAKAHRDLWDSHRLQKELVSEYGDICWGTAVLMRHLGVFGDEGYSYTTAPDPSTALLNRAVDLYEASHDTASMWLDDAAESLWFTLKHHCQAITGASFDDVLAANVAKLADRAARSALQGAGDHR